MNPMKKNIDQFKDQKAFNTPKGYFEDFASRMQHEIEESHAQIKWIESLKAFISLRLAIPSLAVVMLCVIGFQLQDQYLFEGEYLINDKEIQTYLIQEAETEDVMDWAVDEDFISTPVVLEEDIMDFLIEEDIDIETLQTYL